MQNIYRYVILLTILCMSSLSSVQAQQVDYKYHTVFMYNFTKYIKWPESAIGNEFVIGVLGNSAITEHLERMAQSKNVNGKSIVIKTFKSPEEVINCQMLYVPESRSNQLPSLREKLATQPTLIISEKAGLGQQGSVINFVVNNGRWNFELNQASADMHQLKVSSELTKFAYKIYTEI